MEYMSAASEYGVTAPSVPSLGLASPLQVGGSDDIGHGLPALVNPRNPLVIFGLFLLVTTGLAGVAGSVRLGKAKASASVDKS